MLLLCVIVVVVNKANIIHTLVFKARPCGPSLIHGDLPIPKGSFVYSSLWNTEASIISNCVKENGSKLMLLGRRLVVDIEHFISVQLHSE